MRINLINEIHNTKISINVPEDGILSKHQTRKVKRILCGIKECNCGIVNSNRNLTTYWVEGDRLYIRIPQQLKLDFNKNEQ